MARLLFAMALPMVALGVPVAVAVEAHGAALLIAGLGMVGVAARRPLI